MSSDPPHRALAEFGRLTELPSLAFDASGYCCLLVDEITLNLEHDGPGDRLLFYAHLGLVPEPAEPGLYELLLEGNYFCKSTDDCTLGVDLATRAIVLYAARPAAGLDGPQLEEQVTRFVAVAEDWRRRNAHHLPQPAGRASAGTSAAMAGTRFRA